MAVLEYELEKLTPIIEKKLYSLSGAALALSLMEFNS
jgi:hypothetical protein